MFQSVTLWDMNSNFDKLFNHQRGILRHFQKVIARYAITIIVWLVTYTISWEEGEIKLGFIRQVYLNACLLYKRVGKLKSELERIKRTLFQGHVAMFIIASCRYFLLRSEAFCYCQQSKISV